MIILTYKTKNGEGRMEAKEKKKEKKRNGVHRYKIASYFISSSRQKTSASGKKRKRGGKREEKEGRGERKGKKKKESSGSSHCVQSLPLGRTVEWKKKKGKRGKERSWAHPHIRGPREGWGEEEEGKRGERRENAAFPGQPFLFSIPSQKRN